MDRRRNQWDEEETEQEVEDFQKHHRSFSDRVERLLMQCVILGLVALVLVQTLLVWPTFRRVANVVEALEGVSAADFAQWSKDIAENKATAVSGAGSITIMLTSRRAAPEVRLLVDGTPVAAFNSATLTAHVKVGQRLTIDATAVKEPLSFRVTALSGIGQPAPGTNITTHGDKQSLGQVGPAS